MTTERTMTGPGQDYADRVLHEALQGATRGLDLERLEGAVTDGCEAVAKMMAALKATDYTADRDRPVACPSCKTKFVVKTPIDPDVVARALAHATKAQDTAVRLMEFATGRAGQSPGHGERLAARADERAARDRLGLDRGERAGRGGARLMARSGFPQRGSKPWLPAGSQGDAWRLRVTYTGPPRVRVYGTTAIMQGLEASERHGNCPQ